ncbi:MAG TPA: aldo/keto reductase [Kofleriaceae bacterium]|jgi:diketogulonate reductase-like aldo/keto reductase
MTMNVRGVRVPAYLYGTAWKEDATEQCVIDALDAGFRGIDTANQRKHYFEEGVGRALDAKFREGFIARGDLFLQTKFTFRDGQDHRLPYEEEAPIAEQVAQSFASSLRHLGVDTIDSLVLHGPSQRDGLGNDDHEAWRAMEALASSGRVKLLGISNATAVHVEELITFAKIQPAFVQNRCYAERSWDARVREICAANDIIYQGFSLLTANRQVLANTKVVAIAKRYGVAPAQVVFRFAQQVAMLPLTGTRSPLHMGEDLAIHAFTLDTDELSVVNAAGR